MISCATTFSLLVHLANSGQIASTRRITVESARKLVGQYVERLPKSQEYRSAKPDLQDVTPNEVWRRMDAQVFKIKGYTQSVSDIESFMIRRGQVFPLSIGFGGSGLDSMCVADLDADGSPELLYTYSWGSGLHRSHIAALDPNWPVKSRVEIPRQVPDVTLRLKASNDQRVEVRIAHSPGKLLGRLVLRRQGKKRILELVREKSVRKGDFKAQFESIEREQALRGTL
jgi:hypothetical protein